MSKYAEERGENAMANQEHLEKLREGVEAWNQWRVKNPRVQPDLREASLMVAQLQGANFKEAQLQGAVLAGAFFDNTTSLKGIVLEDETYGGISLVDINWGGANLAVVDWSPLKILLEENWACQEDQIFQRSY